jgi:hypothetical protein
MRERARGLEGLRLPCTRRFHRPCVRPVLCYRSCSTSWRLPEGAFCGTEGNPFRKKKGASYQSRSLAGLPRHQASSGYQDMHAALDLHSAIEGRIAMANACSVLAPFGQVGLPGVAQRRLSSHTPVVHLPPSPLDSMTNRRTPPEREPDALPPIYSFEARARPASELPDTLQPYLAWKPALSSPPPPAPRSDYSSFPPPPTERPTAPPQSRSAFAFSGLSRLPSSSSLSSGSLRDPPEPSPASSLPWGQATPTSSAYPSSSSSSGSFYTPPLRPYVEPASSFRQKVDHPSSSQSSNPAPFASRGGFASTGSYANPVEERFGIDSLLTACVSRMSGAARRLLIFDVVQAVCRQAKKKCEGGTPCRRVSGPRSCVLARR